MSTAYVVVTVLGAAMVAFSAGAVFLHAKWVVQPLADYGVPRSWWYSHITFPLLYMAPVLGSLLLGFAAGAVHA